MPITGDLARLSRLAEGMKEYADPESRARLEMAGAVATAVKTLVRAEFSEGIDPSGAAWARTKGGRQALQSKKLAPSVKSYPTATGVLFESRIPWLQAHQEGHTFPARAAVSREALINPRSGRFISATRAAKMKFVLVAAPKAHTVKARVLPARPVFPDETSLPERWQLAAESAVGGVVKAWADRVGK